MRKCRLLLIFLVIALDLHAQSPPLRSLDVIVMNESGVPVTTLTRDSFTLLEESEVLGIEGFSGPDTPWNIVLLLDQSVTQSQTDGIERFIARLRPHDRIALARFGEQVEILMDWKDRTARLPAVAATPGVSGGTKDFYGAVQWAIGKLASTTGRKAAIFVTDGHDRRLAPQWFMNERREETLDPLFGIPDLGEAEEFRRLDEEVRQSGVRFYFLALPPNFGGRLIVGLFPGVKDAVNSYILRVRRRLERLAEASRGHVLYGNSLSDVTGEYGRLYDDLRFGAIYTLEYEPVPRSGLPGMIQVQLKDQKLRALYSRNQ